jgi:L-fuculose-phosphate aldolase
MSVGSTHAGERETLLDEIIRCARRMSDDGLVLGTAGNISVRLDDEIVITPSSMPYELIERSDLCVLDLSGRLLDGRRRPSSESPLHTQVYRTTDAAAVVHTHSPFATTLACAIDVLPAIHYAIHRFGGDTVRVAEYERFGSDELADKVAFALKDRRGALLRNHGAVTYGSSLTEAYDLAVLLEWLSRIYWQAKQLGEPRLLTTAEIDEVAEEARRLRYGNKAAAIE